MQYSNADANYSNSTHGLLYKGCFLNLNEEKDT